MWRGMNVTGYMFIAHLHYLAVQVGFYSVLVEFWLRMLKAHGSIPVRKTFSFTCYTRTLRLFAHCQVEAMLPIMQKIGFLDHHSDVHATITVFHVVSSCIANFTYKLRFRISSDVFNSHCDISRKYFIKTSNSNA